MTALRSFSSVHFTLLAELDMQTMAPEKSASKPRSPQAINPGSTSKQLCMCSMWIFNSAIVTTKRLCVNTHSLYGYCVLFQRAAFIHNIFISTMSLVHSNLFIRAFQSSISQASPWTISLFWASLPPFLSFLLNGKQTPTMEGLHWPSLQLQ